MSESKHGSVTHNIERARGGDGDAKGWLFERFHKLLRDMARDHITDKTRSGAFGISDVVGEVGVRMSKDNLFAGVNNRKHFVSTLRKIVKSEAIDLKRRKATRPAVLIGEDDLLHPEAEDLDFRLATMEELKNALPLQLYETVDAYLECGTQDGTIKKLGITNHELRNRLKEMRDIWSKRLGDE